MHRSKLDIGSADARAGGISLGSSASACGGVPSSSPSDSFAMAHSAGPPQRAPARCAWRRAHRGRGVQRPLRRHRGTRRCCMRASDAVQLSTPCSRRTSPWLHEMPIRPKTGAAMPCSWPRHQTSRRRLHGARVALACAWMQLLKLPKTATPHGCK